MAVLLVAVLLCIVLLALSTVVVFNGLDALRQLARYNEDLDESGDSAAVELCEDLVSNEVFEQRLEEACCRVADPRQGLFGMKSVTWMVARESCIFAAGLRAALLQLAHPFVAEGVLAHSNIKYGVQQRFYRTFKYMFALSYGPLDEVMKAARAVRRIHDRVQGEFQEAIGTMGAGSSYSAHQTAALVWVWATLCESMALMYELMIRKLTATELEQYYAEQRAFLLVFGVPESAAPPTWGEFMEYTSCMWHSPTLTVSPAARKLESFLTKPPSLLHKPMMVITTSVTGELLPPCIAAQFGYRRTLGERAVAAFFFGVSRSVYKHVPESLRFITRYIEAERRVGVQRWRVPSDVAAAVARWYLSLLMPPRPVMD